MLRQCSAARSAARWFGRRCRPFADHFEGELAVNAGKSLEQALWNDCRCRLRHYRELHQIHLEAVRDGTDSVSKAMELDPMCRWVDAWVPGCRVPGWVGALVCTPGGADGCDSIPNSWRRFGCIQTFCCRREAGDG